MAGLGLGLASILSPKPAAAARARPECQKVKPNQKEEARMNWVAESH